MDRILEEAGVYAPISYTKIKCKNFAICGHFIESKYKDECEVKFGEYLCSDCIQQQERDEREERRFKEELDR